MLSRIELILDSKDINIQMGSLFHGFIMETIDTEYAEYLHSLNLNPFNQFLYYNRKIESYVWRVNALNEEAYNKIIKILNGISNIYLKHKNLNIKVSKIIISEPIPIEDFIYNIFTEKIKTRTNIKFATPTSFKSNGKYLNFPNTALIFRSPAIKLNEFSSKIKAIDKSMFNEIEKNTNINRFNFKSTYYHLEKVKINSFIGEISFTVSGNKELIRFSNMLLRLSEFTGIGIKTSLGMGGILIE